MEEYASNLGKLVGNFHSLEFVLRMFLNGRSGAKKTSINYNDLAVGDVVVENAFTNFDSLGQLVEKYNAIVANSDSSLQIPPAVVDLRDAIAHGRLSSHTTSLPLTLLKFSRPKGGQVSVTHATKVDVTWMRDRAREVAAYLKRALEAHDRVPK